MTTRVGRHAQRWLAAVFVCSTSATASAQAAPVPVVAIGQGRTVAAAISAAVGMAVESGAGATVASAMSSTGERLATDSVRAVSRGVVTRYILLDSAAVAGGTQVRILAMVSRIAERDPTGARGQRIAVPGQLWRANADADADRRAGEGELLSNLFGAIDRQPSAFTYEIESGPPVPSGSVRRLRLRVIRRPSAAYATLRDRVRSILAAIDGAAGVRTMHVPALAREQVSVRSCVSHCGPDERRVLNARAALDDTDSLGAFDPPVLTGTRTTPLRTLFPDLPTVGGYAVEFGDSAARRLEFYHVRSTRGYLAIVDYLRVTFDDARFRLEVGDRAVDLLETFRAPYTGQPAARLETTAPAGALPIALVQGFRPHSSGGPGAPTTLGSPYVVISIPAPGQVPADTALVDVWLTPAEIGRTSELGVAPLATTHRLQEIRCPRPTQPSARTTCTRPAMPDVMWRALDDAPLMSAASRAAGSLPLRTFDPPIPAESASATGTAGTAAARAYARSTTADLPAVPLAVLDAIARQPLSTGDGALAVSSTPSTLVAVGTGVVDTVAPTQACAVARLRAQRELTRFLAGSHLESRVGLSTAESRGSPVEEHFREDIVETTAGRVAGAAIAAQWTVPAPPRCRVALWIPDSTAVRRDPGQRLPH